MSSGAKAVVAFLVGRPLARDRPRRGGRRSHAAAHPPPEDAGHASRRSTSPSPMRSRCSSAAGVHQDAAAEPRADRLVGPAVRRGATGRQAHRVRCEPRQAGLRLEGDADQEERGERLLLAGREDRRLHGDPAAHRERRRARDGARARGRARDGRARCRTDRAQAPDRGRSHDHRRGRRVHAGAVRSVTGAARRRRRACRSAARRSPRRTTSDWSTWRERATTRIRRSRSGSACNARRKGTSRRSSSATTRATRIASRGSGAGCPRPSASTHRAPEADRSQPPCVSNDDGDGSEPCLCLLEAPPDTRWRTQ